MRELPKVIERIVDSGAGALSAVWPRSQSAREIGRLTRDGYRAGAPHEMEFAVTFEDACADAVLDDLRDGGFTLRERSVAKPCCTVTARIPLSAYHLHVTTARLQRILAPHGGFAAAIGPLARERASAVQALDPRIELPALRARA